METATRVQRKVTRPRADALRNRERIVTAAREMFTEFGPDVPLDEIARRAGVGNATVYRNFPDRDALAREVVCSVMDRTSEAAEQALAESGDAFAALERFVHVSADERISARTSTSLRLCVRTSMLLNFASTVTRPPRSGRVRSYFSS